MRTRWSQYRHPCQNYQQTSQTTRYYPHCSLRYHQSWRTCLTHPMRYQIRRTSQIQHPKSSPDFWRHRCFDQQRISSQLEQHYRSINEAILNHARCYIEGNFYGNQVLSTPSTQIIISQSTQHHDTTRALLTQEDGTTSCLLYRQVRSNWVHNRSRWIIQRARNSCEFFVAQENCRHCSYQKSVGWRLGYEEGTQTRDNGRCCLHNPYKERYRWEWQILLRISIYIQDEDILRESGVNDLSVYAYDFNNNEYVR